MKKFGLFLLLTSLSLFSNAQSNESLIIDGSSKENLEKSIEKIKSSLNEEEGKEFSMSLFLVTFTLEQKYENENDRKEALLKELNGKNINQIKNMANEIAEKNRAKNLENARQEVSLLYEKKIEADRQLKVLSYVEILDLKLSKKQMFGKDTPIVELVFKNGTKELINQIYFLIKLKNDDEKLNNIIIRYSNKDGVNPNQEVTHAETVLNYKGNVNNMIDNKANLKVTAMKIMDSNYKILYQDNYFTDMDMRRLEHLLSKYPELKKD
ncbi:hypothetical protein DMA11_17130 [Marinilabiliaceae bacterium JC017]|nr:hypothetical protein DMA11_17130 [Marinilabiliaceae bacterium JC017]